MDHITFGLSEDLGKLPEAAEIRRKVFMEEQGFENEFDDTDSISLHCVLYCGGKSAAAGRMYGEGSLAHIGRIAVLKEYRGKGLGSLMMNELEKQARERGYTGTALSAQCRAQRFYEANGYTARGDIYADEGVPHIMMYKDLM